MPSEMVLQQPARAVLCDARNDCWKRRADLRSPRRGLYRRRHRPAPDGLHGTIRISLAIRTQGASSNVSRVRPDECDRPSGCDIPGVDVDCETSLARGISGGIPIRLNRDPLSRIGWGGGMAEEGIGVLTGGGDLPGLNLGIQDGN